MPLLRLGTPLLLLVLVGLSVSSLSPASEKPLVGQAAPAWEVADWIHSEPLALDDLRGEVVLVRWWTGPGCPYCTASAPALNEWHERYRDEGLRVIGFYHHKSRRPLSREWVRTYAEEELNFKFPVAIDHKWATLRNWWLDTGDRDWTSVTFLIDRNGIIQAVHSGGDFVQGEPEYRKLEKAIQDALSQGAKRSGP